MTSRRGPRDDAGQRHLPAHHPGPRPSGTDAQRTPGGDSAGPDLHQARKIGAAWADPGCALGPCFPPFPPFRGPPVVWLGLGPRLFSGARWWIPLERWWKRFRASEEFREMDYLDRTGFIPRPGTPNRSLRWLKDALGKQRQSRMWLNSHGTPSGSSCRIGHSRRTYRGTSASTWETGSRSPRRMSTPGRSDTLCAPSGTGPPEAPVHEAGRAVRVDLGHEDWEDKVECPASPKALFKEVPDTPPSNASWDVIPANKPAITKMAADEVPPPRGPLTVVATTARKGPTYWTQMESQWGATGGRDRSRFRSWRSRTSMLSRRCTWDAPDVSGISPSRARGWPWSPTQHRTPRPPSPSPRTPTRAWTLSRTRRRSSSRKLSEGWIAQVPRALRGPPCLKARRQVGSAGAESPDTQP